MLRQLIQRIQSSQDALKIAFQGSQLQEEKLSEEDILKHIEGLFSEDAVINIDEQDLGMLNQFDEIKVRVIEFETPEFDEKYLSAFQTLKNLDCMIVNIESSLEFSLGSFYQISSLVKQCCHEDASIIIGSRKNHHNQLQLFILGGYGAIDKSVEPIAMINDSIPQNSLGYDDNELVTLFMEELRQNPLVRISTLQRKYSLGFSRVAHHLDIAKAQLHL